MLNINSRTVVNLHPKLTRFAKVFTVLGAVVGILAMILSAPEPSLGPPLGFAFWILLPFALVFWGLGKVATSFKGLLVLTAASCFALAVYVSLLFPVVRLHTPVLLVFIFLPPWQTVWTLTAIAGTLRREFFRRARGRSSREP